MPKKRADGRYQRKITLSDGRQKIVYGRTLAELAQAESEARDADRSGLRVGDHTLVGEWAKIWLETYKSNLRPNTVRMYRGTYNKHIMATLGGMELQSVRPVHIRAVMAKVADKSESLQHKVLLTMRQLFAEARRNHLVAADPTEGVKITAHASPDKVKSVEVEDQQAFVAALRTLEDRRPLALRCAGQWRFRPAMWMRVCNSKPRRRTARCPFRSRCRRSSLMRRTPVSGWCRRLMAGA